MNCFQAATVFSVSKLLLNIYHIMNSACIADRCSPIWFTGKGICLRINKIAKPVPTIRIHPFQLWPCASELPMAYGILSICNTKLRNISNCHSYAHTAFSISFIIALHFTSGTWYRYAISLAAMHAELVPLFSGWTAKTFPVSQFCVVDSS